MKKIYTTLVALLAIAQISYAQTWSGNGTDIYFNTSGKVGIGTSTPGFKLDVNGVINSTSYMSNIEGMYVDGATGMGMNNVSGTLSFRTNNVDSRMVINSSGNVGIGTASPGSDLTIAQGGKGISFDNGGAGYFGTFAFNRESRTGAIFNSSGNAFQINNGNGIDKSLHIQVYNGAGANINPDALTINGTNGGVGINTAAVPANYHFAVNGAAIVTSMTVKLYNAWPDYVFKKGYDLPTLSEVSNYIIKNNRLPDMPSEDQVSKNGINLGELVTLQTKKIEELTLYLIEKDKELKELKSNQKSQFDELKLELKKLQK